MTTMGDVVTAALKRLRVINARKTPDGISASDGLVALNDMMHSWKGVGVNTDHETLESADDFPLDEEHVQGVKALLAVRLSSDYGLEVNQGIVRDADMGWQAIMAEFVEPAASPVFDGGLINTTMGRDGM